MVLYFNFARVAVSRLTGREYDALFRTHLVEHIIGFSLAGLGTSPEGISDTYPAGYLAGADL